MLRTKVPKSQSALVNERPIHVFNSGKKAKAALTSTKSRSLLHPTMVATRGVLFAAYILTEGVEGELSPQNSDLILLLVFH